MDKRPAIILTGNDLTYKDIVTIGIGDNKVELDKKAIEKCKLSRQFLEETIKEKKVIIHGGNSHGQSISFAMDSVCIGISTLCNLSEAR
jgi:histidine ammonia-lyase